MKTTDEQVVKGIDITTINQQIVDVINIVYDTAVCNPAGAFFLLSSARLAKYPDSESILNKLQDEYKVLEVALPVNPLSVPHYEFKGIKKKYGPVALDKVLSYTLRVKPEFYEFRSKVVNNSGITARFDERGVYYGDTVYRLNSGMTRDLLKALSHIRKKYDGHKLVLEAELGVIVNNYPAPHIKEETVEGLIHGLVRRAKVRGIPLECSIKKKHVVIRQI